MKLSDFRQINLKTLLPEPKTLLGKRVGEKDFLESYGPNTAFFLNGELVLVYGELTNKDFDFTGMESILRKMKFSKNRRLTQLRNKTEVENTYDRNFGFNPPNAVFNTSAGPCILNGENPQAYHRLSELGKYLNLVYKKVNPKRHAVHQQFVDEKIKNYWTMPNTVFTQGVVNNANQLGYHFDRDNIPGGWSCMVYLKCGTYGGNLAVPGFGAKLMCHDRTFMMFDGQSLMHGVTPIKKSIESGYRYSIVYYARESMVGLGTAAEELERAKQIELKKHQRRMENAGKSL